MQQDSMPFASKTPGLPGDGQPTSLPRSTIVLMAAACALAASTIYYNQPLLPQMAAEFGRGGADMGLISTLTQLGYASGLFFLTPLGDKVDRKRLILRLLAANVVGLLAIAIAPSFVFLVVASFIVGASAVTAQIVIPVVSGLAAPSERGRIVGSLVSGLSAGHLFARTISGFIGSHGGWRPMFLIAAAIDVALVAIVALRVPSGRGASALSYPALLASVGDLLRREPVLRFACASGFLMFAAFSSLWATLAELLARPPFGWGPGAAGAFGFVGIAGLLSAPLLGRAVDRYGSRAVLLLGALLLIAAFMLVAQATVNILLVVFAAILTDIANRAGSVANQNAIFGLAPEARSRLNTAFMTSYFLGGAAGATIAAASVGSLGWLGLSIAGGAFAVAALFVNLRSAR